MGIGAVAAIGGQVVGGLLSKSSKKKQARATREAAQFAAEQVKPFQKTGTEANRLLGGALGIGDPAQSNQAFENFLGSTGFQRELQAGSQAISGNNAISGLLASGSTVKGAREFGQNLAQGRFQNFLGQLGALSDQGLSAAESVGRTVNEAGQAAAGQEAQGRGGLQQGLGAAFQTARRVFTK